MLHPCLLADMSRYIAADPKFLGFPRVTRVSLLQSRPRHSGPWLTTRAASDEELLGDGAGSMGGLCGETAGGI